MNLQTIWTEFLSIVTAQSGSRVVETWFKSVVFSRWDGHSKTAYLQVPNAFIKEWLVTHYASSMRENLARLLNIKDITLVFLDETKTEIVQAPKIQPLPLGKKAPTHRVLHERYLFETLVVAEHNELAYVTACAVAQQPGAYNPLIIQAQTGLGKTHLLHAIGNGIRTINSKARVVYQTADRFVQEFVTSLKLDKMAAFEQRYRSADVLLFDDLQYLAHKSQTQEIFYQLFTSLYEAGKQIVFSCDQDVTQLEGMNERLKARLSGSLVAHISEPSFNTKVTILEQKAAAQKVALPKEIARFMATGSSSNIRELEGLLVRLLAFATLTHQAITHELAVKVLQKPASIETRFQAPADMPTIAATVAKQFNCSVAQLRSTKRTTHIVLARHVGMYLMKKEIGCAYKDIACFWGRKDHATVIHAMTKIEELMATDEQFARDMQNLSLSVRRNVERV